MTVQTCYAPTDETIDEWFFRFFSLLIILYHLFFIVLFWSAGKKERRKLDPLWTYRDDTDENDAELSVIFVDNTPVPMDSKTNPGWKMQLYHNVVLRNPTLSLNAMSTLMTGNSFAIPGSGIVKVPVPVPDPVLPSSPSPANSPVSVPVPPAVKAEAAVDITSEPPKREMKKPIELAPEQPS